MSSGKAPSPSPELAREAGNLLIELEDVRGIAAQSAIIAAFGQRQYERGREEATGKCIEVATAEKEFWDEQNRASNPGQLEAWHRAWEAGNIAGKLRRAAFDPKGGEND